MTLDRWPDKTPVVDPSKFATPIWQRWFTQLVTIVNSVIDSATALATLVAANTAAIVLLQPIYGSWTPIDASGAGLVFAVATGHSIKIGKQVFVSVDVTYPVTINGAVASIGGLPYTTGSMQHGLTIGFSNYATVLFFLLGAASTTIVLFDVGGGSNPTNANVSGKTFRLSGTYEAAT